MLQWYKDKAVGYSIVLVLLVIAEVRGQEEKWDMNFNYGWATYSMPSMEAYQASIQKDLNLPGTQVERFGPYNTYSFGLNKQWTKFRLGVEFGHGSTGGRVYYADYSGSYTADQLVTYNYLGIVPGTVFYSNKNFQIIGKVKVNVLFFKVHVQDNLIVGNQGFSDSADFNCLNLGIQPNISIRYYLGPLFVQAEGGYEITTTSELRKSDDHSVWLDDGAGHPVTMQASGTRISAGVGIRF